MTVTCRQGSAAAGPRGPWGLGPRRWAADRRFSRPPSRAMGYKVRPGMKKTLQMIPVGSVSGRSLSAMAAVVLVSALIGTCTAFRPWRAAAVGGVTVALTLLASWALRRIDRADRPGSWVWLAAVTGIGFALRLGWVLSAGTVQVSDAAEYVALARNLVEGGYYGLDGRSLAFRPPGLPVAIALLAKAGLPPGLWTGILNALASAATIPAVWLLAGPVAAPGRALFASVLWAVFPSQVFTCSLALTEPIFTALFAWLIVAALPLFSPAGDRSRASGHVVRALLLGVLGAAAAYVRSPALSVPFALLLGAVVLSPVRRRARAVLGAGALLTVVALLPWGLRNQRVFGEFFLLTTNGGTTLYQANNDRATGSFLRPEEWPRSFAGRDDLEVSREAGRAAKEWIRDHPGRFLSLVPRKWYALFRDDVDTVALATNGLVSPATKALARGACQMVYLAAVLLLVLAAARPRRLPAGLLAVAVIVFALWFATHAVFHGQQRFHHALLPVFCALAAHAAPPWPRGGGRG